jgi:hypothetical protein
MKRQEKAKPTFVALMCGQLQLLGTINRCSKMSLIYLHVVTVGFRTDCHFVTEYVRNTNETAEADETNLRGFNMWPVTVTGST